ncbi:CRISPR-associated protein Cas4 [Thermohalobacter berrensis]|uniref:CRISPR-associated exonuclease Cas4 n=1 Tax=Thermohalobacter berrensis TaxID=99594 RepID=A0A419T1D1_9FIRM|nr:CRISPR-associated protein Cas4 [Thermohalobacter berrensis]RKD31277.1 CRISPR-associated protein Cas4 [Thermohalobacter berrensis]
MEDIRVNGTLIWYYHICKREVWLMAHGIVADQENTYMDLGRFIHDNSYSRKKKEVSIGNIKIDVISKGDGQVVVGEVKKSSRFKESSRMQLAYYLWQLKKQGVEGAGILMFPKERKREEINLTDELINELKAIEKDILKIIYRTYPEKPKKIPFCKKCAYSEFCWS